MSRLEQIQAPIKYELNQQVLLMKQALKSDIPMINSVVDYYLEKKGKMIRPTLVLLAAKLAGDGLVTENTIKASVALELLHNASLIHDDVIDESSERRGRQSLNNIWDNKVAVLIGDLFLSRCLIITNETRSLEIQSVMAHLSSYLAEGELRQLETAQNRKLSEETYYSVIHDKTASLFVACMRLGAISVDASVQTQDLVAELGSNLGLMFQIRDDIFDYYESTVVGKPTGNDIREGKVTLPLLHCLLNGGGEENVQMVALLDKGEIMPEDISTLVAYAKNNGGIEYAYLQLESLAAKAHAILDKFPDSDVRNSMRILINYMIERKY